MTTMQANIIIGSAPSSGSTLLVNIIGRSPQVFQCGELSIFDKRDWIIDEKTFSWNLFERLYRRGYKRRLACEMSHHLSNFEGLPSSCLATARESNYLDHCEWLMSQLANHHNKNMWVEKTPANIFSMGIISERRPRWRYVAIVRDPRSVLLSLSKRGYSNTLAAARWYLPNLVAWNLSHSGRAILVRYEDLIDKPEHTVKGLFNQLGIGYSCNLLTAPKEDAFALKSWHASPAEAPKKVGLWTNDKCVPSGYLEALSVICPSPTFISEHELNAAPNAMDLAYALGYDFCWEIDKFSHLSIMRSMATDYLLYASAMMKRFYLPRPAPFYFRRP